MSLATEVRLEWLRALGLGGNLGDDDVACEGDGMIKGGVQTFGSCAYFWWMDRKSSFFQPSLHGDRVMGDEMTLTSLRLT